MATFSLLLWIISIPVLVIWLLRIFARDKRKLPPGVKNFAAVKFLLNSLMNGFDEESSALMRTLNTDLVSVDLFGRKTWIIFGSQAKLVEAYQKNGDLLLRRPDNPVRPDTVGLVGGHGASWREQRRFALTTLRNLGMGKTSVEHRIQNEVHHLIQVFDDKNGQPFDPMTAVGTAVVNVISQVIFSTKFEYGDPDLSVFLEVFNQATSGSNTRVLMTLSMFECFFKFPGVKRKVVQVKERLGITRGIIERKIRKALKDEAEENENFVVAYSKEMKERKDDSYTSFTEKQLTDAVEDLFGAGSETTSTTLRWALLLMAHNPEIQTKVFHELREHFNHDRLPSFADREKTPFTEAVLCEIQRFASLAPLNRRLNVEEVQLFGYTIEPGTIFVANLWHMHRDENIWERPHAFEPSRFFGEDGRLVNKDKMNPFSLGKRQCLGESLAKMELYLFFTAFILNFHFQAPEGVTLPLPSSARVGLVRAPLPFEICAVKRS